MKKKLILYLSEYNKPGNALMAATLAWLAKSKNYLFDNYFDSYHQGIHFPGGDSRVLDQGQITGGMVAGEHHFEEFYFLLHNFNVSIVCSEKSIFLSTIKNFNIPFISMSNSYIADLKKIFCHFNESLPREIILVGSNFKRSLSGLDSYVYPEIYYRCALGLPDSISDEALADLCPKGGTILCLFVDDQHISHLLNLGYQVQVIDQLEKDDNYLTITKRIALRWQEYAKGWILGDPALVSYWVPKACDEDLISIYGIPQERAILEFGKFLASKGKVVYGRQYSDRDFFELSKHNQCFQVIDPCRPPFQSVKHIQYVWQGYKNEDGFYELEYTDEELRQFAQEGRILISLMFWSGMIREIANLYNLMDLFAMTKLNCGLVLTSQSYEYMTHSPLELLAVPLENGGVYPLVEPVLGSCGIGVGIESHITKKRLQETLGEALSKIFQQLKNYNYMPMGWWPTMDVGLEKLSFTKRPKPLRFLKYAPYIQIRYKFRDKKYEAPLVLSDGAVINTSGTSLLDKLKQVIIKTGLTKYFEQYRPYEFFQAGQIKKDIIEVVKETGLRYMFTKSGFNENPEAKYIDDDFIAMNYTSGQWDGWTPFETVNDVSDLKKTEKLLIKRKNPGWIVSTIDSCLWTFSGEFWKRGSRLFDIAQFCCSGGDSGKLINVKPVTVSRYARIIHELGQN